MHHVNVATNSFVGQFVLERSLSYTHSTKTIERADYCLPVTIRQVSQDSNLRHCLGLQGFSILAYSNINEDSLIGDTRMLKIWVPYQPKLIRTWIFARSLLDTAPDSHSRGFPTIHLSKSTTNDLRHLSIRRSRLSSLPSSGSHIVSRLVSLSTGREQVFCHLFGLRRTRLIALTCCQPSL